MRAAPCRPPARGRADAYRCFCRESIANSRPAFEGDDGKPPLFPLIRHRFRRHGPPPAIWNSLPFCSGRLASDQRNNSGGTAGYQRHNRNRTACAFIPCSTKPIAIVPYLFSQIRMSRPSWAEYVSRAFIRFVGQLDHKTVTGRTVEFSLKSIGFCNNQFEPRGHHVPDSGIGGNRRHACQGQPAVAR